VISHLSIHAADIPLESPGSAVLDRGALLAHLVRRTHGSRGCEKTGQCSPRGSNLFQVLRCIRAHCEI
jgi:hypothetical protein